MPIDHSADPYQRLGIHDSASADEVRAAYRALLRQHPPERAPREFRRIREAYEVLGAPGSRARYDGTPDAVKTLLHLGLAAMDAGEFAEAQAHLRQALAHDPTLDYARNWLGLCLCYQDKHEQALPVFQQLLQRDEPQPAWLANTGRALARLRDADAAEQMFRRALAAAEVAGDDVPGYAVALAGLCLERSAPDAAEEVLERALRRDGEVDVELLRCLAALLGVQLARNDAGRVKNVLNRIRLAASDPAQRDYAAWKLASLAAGLIAAGSFAPAETLTRAAGELRPDDSDVRTLAQVASLLNRKMYAETEQMLRTHPCLWGEGRFAAINQAIRKHCSHMRLGNMKPLRSLPALYTTRGFGTRLYGERDHDPHTRSHVATQYFVGMYLPLFPLACYRVVPVGEDSWRFLGKVPFSRQNRTHLAGFLMVASLFAVLVALAPPPADGSSYDASAAGYAETDDAAAADPGAVNTFAAPGASSAPAAAATEDSAIESERARVRGLEAPVARLASRRDSLGGVIDQLAGQIHTMESKAGDGQVSDKEYRQYNALVNRHNAMVETYRDLQAQVERKVREYDAARAALNHRIELYNAAQ